MKKRKTLFLTLLFTAFIGLSSCKALFSDDDMSIYNSFNDIVSIIIMCYNYKKEVYL